MGMSVPRAQEIPQGIRFQTNLNVGEGCVVGHAAHLDDVRPRRVLRHRPVALLSIPDEHDVRTANSAHPTRLSDRHTQYIQIRSV